MTRPQNGPISRGMSEPPDAPADRRRDPETDSATDPARSSRVPRLIRMERLALQLGRNAAYRAVSGLVRDFEWVHTLIGIFGNTTFFVGSILFFWQRLEVIGVWLFTLGSLGMLIGSLGAAIVRIERSRMRGERKRRRRQETLDRHRDDAAGGAAAD